MKHIIFDFGNVLLDIDINLTVEALKELGVSRLDTSEIHPHNKGIFLLFETGDITTYNFCEELKKMSDKPLTNNQILDAWNKLLLPYDFSRFEMINRLREAGYHCHILSNTNAPHHKYFETMFNQNNPWSKRFKDMFDRVFYSDELKIRKPNKEIYNLVQKELCCEGSDILFIDDNAPNLVYPKELGWQTYHLVAPNRVTDAINELLSIKNN